MSMDNSEPDQRDLDQRLDEERAAGAAYRPVQLPATEDVEQSVAEEHRATPRVEDDGLA